jgi:hypothetical protein
MMKKIASFLGGKSFLLPNFSPLGNGITCYRTTLHRQKQGKLLSCQMAFRNGQAMVNHYNKVDPLLSVLFDGAAMLDAFEVHGADSELVKTRAVTKKFQRRFKGLKLKEVPTTKDEKRKLSY